MSVLSLYSTIFTQSPCSKDLISKYAITGQQDAGLNFIMYHSIEVAQLLAYGCVVVGGGDVSLKFNELLEKQLIIHDQRFNFPNRDEDYIDVESVKTLHHLLSIDPDIVHDLLRDLGTWLVEFERTGDAFYLKNLFDIGK